jgi:hypothetical protein
MMPKAIRQTLLNGGLMSLSARELALGRRRYLRDLSYLMNQVDREQEQAEKYIKTILNNPKRIPEPKDYERIAQAYIEIIPALDTFAKLLNSGLPDGPYQRQYQQRRRTTRRATTSSYGFV